MRYFVVFALILAISSAKISFRGDEVITLLPKTDNHTRIIQQLESTPGLVDFWNPKYSAEVQPGNKVDVRIPSNVLSQVKDMMKAHGIEYQVKIPDVQELIDNELKSKDAKASHDYDYHTYHTIEEINQWTEDIAASYPNLVKRDVLGQSYEGQDISMLTISTNMDNPAILIDCGFHAREWVSPAFCQCFTRNLLHGYDSDPGITNHMNRLTFYIIPVVNVDGYRYSWNEDRMWRKTRSNYGTACDGVDPNRNCDSAWSGPGASSNPCAETYYGPTPESEIEVKLLADFMRENVHNIWAYITVHSYSQVIIYPYGYTFEVAPTADIMHKYAEQASKAIGDVFGTKYEYGQTSRIFYRAAGGSDDYAYDIGIPLSYTFELRDTGEYGFILPWEQIEPSCVETTAGVRVIVDGALELYHNSQQG